MNDREAVLRAILLDPADDAARWAFADACEEAGDAWLAEFVRCQMRLASGAGLPDDPASQGVMLAKMSRRGWPDRHSYLLAAADDPVAEVERIPPGRLYAVLHRGFVARVWTDTRTFLRNAGRLGMSCPLERVRLTDLAPAKHQNRDWVAGPEWVYRWGATGAVAGGHYLPRGLFRRLRDGQPRRDAGGGLYARDYDGEAHALADLSAACIALARDEAGAGRW